MKRISLLMLTLALSVNMAFAAGLTKYVVGDVGTNESIPAVSIGNRVAITATGSKVASFYNNLFTTTGEVAYIDRAGNLNLDGGLSMSSGAITADAITARLITTTNESVTGTSTIETARITTATIGTATITTGNITTANIATANTTNEVITGTSTMAAVDINSGNIDGVTIGASSAAAGTFTSLTATNENITGTATIESFHVNTAQITSLRATTVTTEGTAYFGTTGTASVDSSGNLKTSGAITATGNITGNTFNGSGTGLTGVGLLASNNTFTGVNTFEGKTYFGASGTTTTSIDASGNFMTKGVVKASNLVTAETTASGVYTPFITKSTNVAELTTAEATFYRIGNLVVVDGQFMIDPTTAAIATQIFISLPLASNLTSTNDLTGLVESNSGENGSMIIADTVNDRAQADFTPNHSANANTMYHFIYRVQ